MPTSGDFQPASQDTYRTALLPVKVQLHPVQKILRWLGVSRVRILYGVTPNLPEHPVSPLPGSKHLSRRQVKEIEPAPKLGEEKPETKNTFNVSEPSDQQAAWNDISRQYLGFRANTRNLNCLYHDLLQSNVACLPGEDHAQYRNRIAYALVACGLADIKNGLPKGKNTLNTPVTAAHLQQLQAKLELSFVDLASDVINRSDVKIKSRFNKALEQQPEVLVELCSSMPVKTKEDALFISDQCRQYLTLGEGRKVLAKHGFSQAVGHHMAGILPGLDAGSIDQQVLQRVQKYRDSNKVEDISGFSGNVSRGITLAPGQKKLQYNPDSPEHRCLMMIQELASLWVSHCEGHMFSLFHLQDVDSSELIRTLKEANSSLTELRGGMSHAIMLGSKEFSAIFDSKNYQQLVLRRNDDKFVCWNSDSVQPRGGWLNRGWFKSVHLPKIAIKNKD